MEACSEHGLMTMVVQDVLCSGKMAGRVGQRVGMIGERIELRILAARADDKLQILLTHNRLVTCVEHCACQSNWKRRHALHCVDITIVAKSRPPNRKGRWSANVRSERRGHCGSHRRHSERPRCNIPTTLYSTRRSKNILFKLSSTDACQLRR